MDICDVYGFYNRISSCHFADRQVVTAEEDSKLQLNFIEPATSGLYEKIEWYKGSDEDYYYYYFSSYGRLTQDTGEKYEIKVEVYGKLYLRLCFNNL